VTGILLMKDQANGIKNALFSVFLQKNCEGVENQNNLMILIIMKQVIRYLAQRTHLSVNLFVD